MPRVTQGVVGLGSVEPGARGQGALDPDVAGGRLWAGRVVQGGCGMQCSGPYGPLALFYSSLPPAVASWGGGGVVTGDCHLMSHWTTEAEDSAPGRAQSLCKGLEALESLALVEPSSG